MGKFKDQYYNSFLNAKFGRLTIIEIVGAKNEIMMVLCKCDCGTIKEFQLKLIKAGYSRSCGCVWKTPGARTHGITLHPLYWIWCGMKARCYNKNLRCFKDYGGRGITVCNEWLHDAKAFYDWCMANGWKQGLDIDRRRNDGIYSPENCRFVTDKVNSRNRRSSKMYTHNGETMILIEWAEKYKINYKAFFSRVKKGWAFEKCLTYKRKAI